MRFLPDLIIRDPLSVADLYRTHSVGFLLANEQTIMKAHGSRFFIALVWAQSAINVAKNEGRIKEEIGAQKLFYVRIYTVKFISLKLTNSIRFVVDFRTSCKIGKRFANCTSALSSL